MKAVIQRAGSSSVIVNDKIVGKINKGMMILLGIEKNDTEKIADYLVKKILNLRIFEDNFVKMNLSIIDCKGEILVISQFTLLANIEKGNRPSFERAEEPMKAQKLYNYFVSKLKESGLTIQTGSFGEKMEINLKCYGPVTIII
jgi:D-tyrosyl-tRNA(Tyr) deacylase